MPQDVVPMPAHEAVSIAQRHIDRAMYPLSARCALDEAEAALAKGNRRIAKERAKASLFYSVGDHHADYKIVLEALNAADI